MTVKCASGHKHKTADGAKGCNIVNHKRRNNISYIEKSKIEGNLSMFKTFEVDTQRNLIKPRGRPFECVECKEAPLYIGYVRERGIIQEKEFLFYCLNCRIHIRKPFDKVKRIKSGDSGCGDDA